MSLPFTREAFFDVFEAYNGQLWPFALGLWLMTVYAFVASIRAKPTPSRLVPAVLAFHWAWAAVAYHAAFFSRINPAAWGFSGLFLVQAGLLFWHGVVRKRPATLHGTLPRRALSWGLILYGLLYPALVLAEGHAFPRLPTFGVPCPTTILTIGFLLAADRSLPRTVVIIPLLWAAIGGSAALLLGVRTDLMLFGAGFALAVDLLRPAHARSTGPEPVPAISSRR